MSNANVLSYHGIQVSSLYQWFEFEKQQKCDQYIRMGFFYHLEHLIDLALAEGQVALVSWLGMFV